MPKYILDLASLKTDRRAVTAIEYGLIAALITSVIIVVLSTIGTEISGTFATLRATM